MRIRWVALASAFALGSCTGSSPTGLTSDSPLPAGIATVRATLAFGDSPLEGLLEIRPSVGTAWRYSVDFDEDGNPEEVGQIGFGVSLSYRYDDPGIHPITVWLERPGESHRVDRIVVVNDPSALEVIERAVLGFEPEGIAFAPDDGALYVTSPPDRLLYAMDPGSFTVQWSTTVAESLPGGYHLGITPILADGALYVDGGDSLVFVPVPGGEGTIHKVAQSGLGTYLQLTPEGDVLSGGFAGIARIELPSGRTTAERRIEDGMHYDLHPDGSTVAHLRGFARPTVEFLESRSLIVKQRLALPEGLGGPGIVAYSPAGDRLYLLLVGDPGLHFLMMEVGSGAILRHMAVARDDPRRLPQLPGFSSPTARSKDGRYVVLSSPAGAFFIDTQEDLPRFRTDDDPENLIGCCDVTLSMAGDFYFTEWHNHAITRLRIHPEAAVP
jgi:hypothetical protein